MLIIRVLLHTYSQGVVLMSPSPRAVWVSGPFLSRVVASLCQDWLPSLQDMSSAQNFKVFLLAHFITSMDTEPS